MNKVNKKNTAFTLIELSVVILIIALLMFGTFSSSSGIVNNVKDNISKDRMNVIYNALGNFLLQKKRLPCPASILLPKGDVNYGKEVRNSSTLECNGAGIYSSNSLSSLNLVFGMVPTYDLNLPADFAEDAFGNKISYFIDQRFTYNYISSPDSNLNIPSFGTANYKDIILVKSRNQQNEILVNSDAIIVLVSGGANGFGSFKNNGIQNTRSSLA
jgi:prepilin-type N-terminal cleavage/methylation domain-containing protein